MALCLWYRPPGADCESIDPIENESRTTAAANHAGDRLRRLIQPFLLRYRAGNQQYEFASLTVRITIQPIQCLGKGASMNTLEKLSDLTRKYNLPVTTENALQVRHTFQNTVRGLVKYQGIR